MNDSSIVQVKNSLQYLLDDFCDIPLAEVFAYDNLLEELASLAKFQDEDVLRFEVIDFEKAGDVGVIKGLHDSHLGEKLLVLLFA